MINKAKNENFITLRDSTFSSLSNVLSEENKLIFRKLISEIMMVDISSKEKWEGLLDQIEKVLRLFDATSNENTKKFVSWAADEAICDSDGETSNIAPINCLICRNENDGRCVELVFGSIHSVKGRTHLATLVLETYSRTHNMKSIIKYLCNSPPKSTLTNQNRIKCQYVAMTRAKGLLCLAIPKEFVNEKAQNKLQDLGWNLKMVD